MYTNDAMHSTRSLESYKIFPIIAWTLVLGFSLFVYTIVQDLRATTAELAIISEQLELHANTPPNELGDLSR